MLFRVQYEIESNTLADALVSVLFPDGDPVDARITGVEVHQVKQDRGLSDG